MRVSVLVGKALVLGGSGLLFPKAKMFYDAYDLHDPRAFGTCERIDLPGSSPGQAAIFWMRRAQLFLNSSDEPFGSRIEGIKRS